MSITAEEKLHGAAILRLIEELGKALPTISTRLITGESRSSYIFSLYDLSGTSSLGSKSLVIYLKSTRKRRGPWRFVFHRNHQEELKALKMEHSHIYIGFICGDDGIAAVDFATLKTLLDDEFGDQETVTVRRNVGGMYRLSGSDGALRNAVSRSGFPTSICEGLKFSAR